MARPATGVVRAVIGALRAAAGVLRGVAAALRAAFAAVFFATFFFAVLRAPSFRAVALFFLLVVRFFPLFFVAMACAPILP